MTILSRGANLFAYRSSSDTRVIYFASLLGSSGVASWVANSLKMIVKMLTYIHMVVLAYLLRRRSWSWNGSTRRRNWGERGSLEVTGRWPQRDLRVRSCFPKTGLSLNKWYDVGDSMFSVRSLWRGSSSTIRGQADTVPHPVTYDRTWQVAQNPLGVVSRVDLTLHGAA
jgi:hypothetical protein